MRTLTSLAVTLLIVLAFTSTDEAQAGLRNYMICWTMPNGHSDCAILPRNYRIYGISRPYCERTHVPQRTNQLHADSRPDCQLGPVDRHLLDVPDPRGNDLRP